MRFVMVLVKCNLLNVSNLPHRDGLLLLCGVQWINDFVPNEKTGPRIRHRRRTAERDEYENVLATPVGSGRTDGLGRCYLRTSCFLSMLCWLLKTKDFWVVGPIFYLYLGKYQYWAVRFLRMRKVLGKKRGKDTGLMAPIHGWIDQLCTMQEIGVRSD